MLGGVLRLVSSCCRRRRGWVAGDGHGEEMFDLVDAHTGVVGDSLDGGRCRIDGEADLDEGSWCIEPNREIIERMPRVLARVASEPLSTFFAAYHRARGVEILTGAEVAGFEADGVRLADGRLIGSDATLVGVGAAACDQLAGDRIVAVEAVNAPPEFMAGRQMIVKRTPVDAARLADPEVSMKAIAAG